MLLILLVAGCLVYNFLSRPTLLWDKKLSDPAQMPRTQLRLSGVVLKYGSNSQGDIDKILLSQGHKKIWLHFPPHTARQVTAAAKINDPVQATVGQKYFPGPNPGEVFELEYLRSNSSNTAVDMSQIPAPFPKKGA